MRLFTAMVMVLLGSTNASAAPTRPNQARIDEIQAVLDKRKLAMERANSAELRKKDVESLIGLRDSQGHPLPLHLRAEECAKRLLGLGHEIYEDYASVTRDYKLAQEEIRTLSMEAIGLAKNAYQSTPAKSSGQIVSGPPLTAGTDDIPGFIGQSASYAPKYSERLPQGTSGTTDDAGNVLIGPDAFDSPGKLAFTLYHEGEHFEKLLTPGLNLRNLPQEEVSARERQRHLLKTTFDFSDKAIEDFDKVLAADRSRAEKWRRLIVQGLDPYKLSHQPAFPSSREPMRLEDDVHEEVDRILARTKELREQERREELARIERRQENTWAEIDAAAGRCAYSVTFQNNTGVFMGFQNESSYLFFRSPYKTPLDLNDIKLALMVGRACTGVKSNARLTSPEACNAASPLMQTQAARSDFPAKLDYMFGPRDSSLRDPCVTYLFDQAASITDAASFDKAVKKYQKKVENERREHDKNWKIEEPEKSSPDRTTPPRDADPGCSVENGVNGCPR